MKNLELIESIRYYFETHPAIKVKGIEREAGMPNNTLSNFLSDKVDRSIPKNQLPNLVETLKRYGYEE